MHVFVLFEILGQLLNTLTADEKYSLHNSENLQQTTQILLPKKQKTFSKFFALLLKYTSKF